MKRADLKVDEAYYYNPHQDWHSSTYGAYRAVVVAEGAWKVDRMTWQRTAPKPYQVDKGSGVLVDVYTHDGDEHPTRKVVPTAHMRGPYEETAAQVAEGIRLRREREQAERDARDDVRRNAKATIQRAQSMGIVAVMNGTNIEVTAAVLERLLDAMEAGK